MAILKSASSRCTPRCPSANGKAWISACMLALAMLTGCKNSPYTITLNDNVLYSPSEAIINQIVDDSALQACLNKALAASEGASPEQIKLLACPGSGIVSLGGISVLTALEQLELSDNRIDNLSPLQPLKNLRVLGLRNNDLRNVGVLENMTTVRFISLQGNNEIPCAQLDRLSKRIGNSLGKPEICVD